MMPGATALTVTPSATNSMAKARVRPTIPAFAAAYAASAASVLLFIVILLVTVVRQLVGRAQERGER